MLEAQYIRELLDNIDELKLSNAYQTKRAEEQHGIILEEIRKGNEATLARSKAEAFPSLQTNQAQTETARQNRPNNRRGLESDWKPVDDSESEVLVDREDRLIRVTQYED